MKKINNEKAFTLIEVLLYTAIFAIVGGLTTGILLTVTQVQQRESASAEVTGQLNFVMQRIQQLVRESSNIEIPTSTATSIILKLRMQDDAKDPTYISLSGNAIELKEGSSATTTLTSDKVIVNTLNFKKFTQYPGHDTVSLDITMTYNSQNPESQVQRTLSSAIARVSAATFDSSLLPGSTSFTVGQAGSGWQNVFVGDGSVGSPSYSFGADTNVGIFRAGTDILGFTTNSTERMRIDANGNVGIGTSTPATLFTVATTTNIFNVLSSGNVGIGTTTPAYMFQVAGTFGAATSTFTGSLNMSSSTIINVADPVNNQDVATKAWVLANAGGGGGASTRVEFRNPNTTSPYSYSWTVPSGKTTIYVTMCGAGGAGGSYVGSGGSSNGAGGGGAGSACIINYPMTVVSNESLTIYVGQGGGLPNTSEDNSGTAGIGGFGGGNGSTPSFAGGGGGGGASKIVSAGLTIGAGGGGGGGGYGYYTEYDYYTDSGGGGGGGATGAGGAGGSTTGTGGTGGANGGGAGGNYAGGGGFGGTCYNVSSQYCVPGTKGGYGQKSYYFSIGTYYCLRYVGDRGGANAFYTPVSNSDHGGYGQMGAGGWGANEQVCYQTSYIYTHFYPGKGGDGFVIIEW